jgi:hypothetical protein
MIAEDRRIVTFMGEMGKRIASIGMRHELYEIEMECNGVKLTKFVKTEEEAEEVAKDFAFKGKYGTF